MTDEWKCPDKLPILTTESFSRWKYEIVIILKNRGLWKITNKEEKPPKALEEGATQQAITAYNKELEAWYAKDEKAKEILTRSLDERHHDMIRSCKYARKIWETIMTLYEQKTGTSVLLAQREFHEIKWTPTDTVLGFFGRLRTVANKLEALGSEVAETLIISKIISEAPVEYSALKESWEVSLLSGVQLNLDSLLGQMVRVERQKNQMKPAEPKTSPGDQGSAYLNRERKPFEGECFNCGKKGHSKAKCWAPGGGAYKADEEHCKCRHQKRGY